MNKVELIKNPRNDRSHIVLLGAGASRAALPHGDIKGNKIPVMADLEEIINLNKILKNSDIDYKKNFEELYPDLPLDLQQTIEKKIIEYFSSLSLPNCATDYDRLLLSLCEKDAIFTFNWDPFLFDSYCRNKNIIDNLPEIFFLHGNVRIGFCENITCKDKWGGKGDYCPLCGSKFSDVPLLYPIKEKQYFENSSGYIKSVWQSAREFLNKAFTLTIFGYSAPTSDIGAKNLLLDSWFKFSEREMEHIEIIDKAKKSVLHERWKSFAPGLHYSLIQSLEESRLSRWPRRTCEALFCSMSKGEPCEKFPLPKTDDLAVLQLYIKDIVKYEKFQIPIG